MDDKSRKDELLRQLNALGVKPNENLGQHFLISLEALNILAGSVIPGNTIIEIGSGVGNLTKKLAHNPNKIISYEIDRRYKPLLSNIENKYSNVEVIYGDALRLNWYEKTKQDETRRVQIISNLPYHISEPFMRKIAGEPIERATLVIGKKLADTMIAGVNSGNFSRLSLLTQTFFRVSEKAVLGRDQFYPEPRTTSSIVGLLPRQESEFKRSRRDYALRRLLLTSRKNPLIKNCLKDALVEHSQLSQTTTLSNQEYPERARNVAKDDLKASATEYDPSKMGLSESKSERSTIAREAQPLTQNQAREMINQLGISRGVLDKPFDQIDSAGIKEIAQKLRF